MTEQEARANQESVIGQFWSGSLFGSHPVFGSDPRLMANAYDPIRAGMMAQQANVLAPSYAAWRDKEARDTMITELRRLAVPDWHLAAWLLAFALVALLTAL